MPDKNLFELIRYCWTYSKNKIGLGIVAVFAVFFWCKFIFPFFEKDKQAFITYSSFTVLAFFVLYISWLLWSGRVLIKKPEFTIVFCLKPKDAKSAKYIDNALSMLKSELDKLGLLNKFQIIIAGSDVINNQQQAHKFRANFDVDLIIWGDVYSGSIDNNEVCDFKNLLFTYKIPENLANNNLTPYFKNDINIALVNRDWNVYEVNSIIDTEKITYNLSEVIVFVLGIIYCQYKEFIEDSIGILERLFSALGARTNGDKISIDNDKQEITMSPNSLRTGRLLAILTTIYKNIGIEFTNENKFERAYYYLNKYLSYNKNDIPALSSMAICCFKLKDLTSAKKHTESIAKIDNNSPFYILNQAFFGIHDKNYARALYFYKEISKRGMTVDPSVVTGVIAFLDRRYRSDRKEIGYEFAIGILNTHHCQHKEGIKELRKFVQKAKKKAIYNEMVAYAITILKSRE